MKKLTHIITGLHTGGAEMMLYKLLSLIDKETFAPEVISLMDIGSIGKKIQKLGVPVTALGMRRGIPDPVSIYKLTRQLRQIKPDIIQTWMYHPDLIGGVAAKMAGRFPVVWGIHHSNLAPEEHKKTTIWTAKICARLSDRLPEKIICCSEASRRVHTALGYVADKMVVIPNGFDLSIFKPNQEARQRIRHELAIREDTALIGMVGRFHPLKDHANFVRAATLLKRECPEINFLLCGDDVDGQNVQLSNSIEDAGLTEKFHLLGRRSDIPAIMNSLDIVSSSSSGEGFPNVVGEAMACGVPCVVTDVGDSAMIVGDTGIVVPPKDPHALALGWKQLIELGSQGRQELGEKSRKRIMENFSLPVVVKQYEELYANI